MAILNCDSLYRKYSSIKLKIILRRSLKQTRVFEK
jgi:hypothetical protein